jgi:tetratricopeptide (TPR) repeat protein
LLSPEKKLQADYVQFIKKFPAESEGYLLVANQLAEEKNYEDAFKILIGGLSKVAVRRPLQHAVAQLYFADEQWERGLLQLMHLLRAAPMDTVLWRDYLRGIDQLIARDLKGELPDVSREIHLKTAYELADKRQLTLSIRHMLRAIGKGEQSVAVLNDLGCMITPVLGGDVAIPFFRLALATAPNYREAASNLAHAQAHTDKQSREQAIQQLLEAVKSGEPSAAIQNELGELYARDGDLSTARVHFERAVEIDSTHAPSWLGLGQVKFRAGSLNGALKAVELAVAHRGEWLEPLYWHSWLLLQQKRDDISEDQELLIAARESQLENQDNVYYQALGRLLVAQRYYKRKPAPVAKSKVRHSMFFAEEFGFTEIQAKSKSMLDALTQE